MENKNSEKNDSSGGLKENSRQKKTEKSRPRDEKFDVAVTPKRSPERRPEDEAKQSGLVILGIILAGALTAVFAVVLFYSLKASQRTVITVKASEELTEERTVSEEKESSDENESINEESSVSEETETFSPSEEETGTEKESTEETEQTVTEETDTEETGTSESIETDETTDTAETSDTETGETIKESDTTVTESSGTDARESVSEETEITETKAEPETEETFEYGGFQFLIKDNAALLLRCYGADEVVELPRSVNGYVIEEIGEGAFEGCEHVYYLKFQEGLKIIGEGAFKNCKNLTEVVFPDSLVSIGDHAFDFCPEFTVIAHKNTLGEQLSRDSGLEFVEGSFFTIYDEN